MYFKTSDIRLQLFFKKLMHTHKGCIFVICVCACVCVRDYKMRKEPLQQASMTVHPSD